MNQKNLIRIVKKLDVADISLIVSSIALTVSILGVLYSRQRTKIAKKQLEQQQQLLERKKRYEEVSRTILQAVKIIKEHTNVEEFLPNPLDLMSTDVLRYMHDNHLETVEINIRPQKLELTSPSSKEIKIIKDFKNVEGVVEAIKERIIEAIKREISYSPMVLLHYDCDPISLSNPFLDFGEFIYNFEYIYFACKLLENYENDIVVFDNTILGDLKQNIDSLVKMFGESLVSEHTIIFSSADKSKQIFQKLKNGIIDFKSMTVLLNHIRIEICDRRLIAIQREIFSKT